MAGDVEQCVAGGTLHGFAEALGELYGRPMVEAGLARLPLEERIQVEQAKAQLWVPIGILGRAVDAWAIASGVSDEELTVRGVRLSTRNTVNHLFRVLLRVTTDEALIARTQALYSRVRNVGTLSAQVRGPQSARLTLTGWRNGTDRQLLSFVVAVETLLELTGRPHARSKVRRTSDGGVMDLSWGDPAVPGRPFGP